ncbi:hypothetical protein KJ611_01440 [Patescibacteria group bacterium]|nr:hypothetical protein [Patescibacteria group bacterium]MBU1705164.1 hypothetical protein [Patescibacteria group bacterium]
MEVSLFLGKVIALYFIIMALFLIIKKKSLKSTIENFWKNDGSMMFMSAIVLIMGLMVVVSHKVWTADWRIIVTLVGWLMLLKGVALLFFPDWLKNLSKKMMKDSYMLVAGVIWFIIGLYLLMNVL